MKRTLLLLFAFLLCSGLSLGLQRPAQAQFTYTYFPRGTAIHYPVKTDLAIVGFAGGSIDFDNGIRDFTSPSSPTVQVVAGADLSYMLSFNHSTVNAIGGRMDGIYTMDSSTLNLAGTTVDYAFSFEDSVINMKRGSVGWLGGQGRQINVTGGTVGLLEANVNTDWTGWDFLGSCVANVWGGTFTERAAALNSGILNVYGGDFQEGLAAWGGGTVNIFGSGLTATLVDPDDNGYSLYSLSGTLQDGTVLTNKPLYISNWYYIFGPSSFTLNEVRVRPGYKAN